MGNTNQSKIQGIILYRGETPGAIGFDVHGGYGQTWTTDPIDACDYGRGPGGYVKQAVLPSTAKRLVLLDPARHEYNWAGIAELERLTDNPYIARQLHIGYPIYDIWTPRWTCLLQQAGYDSIATVGCDGPEEYVLNPAKLVMLGCTTPEELKNSVKAREDRDVSQVVGTFTGF